MLKGLHTGTVWPAAGSALASGRWYDPVASMPTRAAVPNVASQAKQALMPTEVFAKRRTSSAYATSNQWAEMSTPNVWMLIVCLQRGSRLAEERTDPSGHAGACRLGRLGYRPTWVVLEVRGLFPTAASQRQRQKQALRTSRFRAPRAPPQHTGRRSLTGHGQASSGMMSGDAR